jgi:hypothetical protein
MSTMSPCLRVVGVPLAVLVRCSGLRARNSALAKQSHVARRSPRERAVFVWPSPRLLMGGRAVCATPGFSCRAC